MEAFISMKGRPKDVYEDALVALGGPIVGSIGALSLGAAGAATDIQMLTVLADFGLMINLFNLLPIGQVSCLRLHMNID